MRCCGSWKWADLSDSWPGSVILKAVLVFYYSLLQLSQLHINLKTTRDISMHFDDVVYFKWFYKCNKTRRIWS